jgi:hypothetical protein
MTRYGEGSRYNDIIEESSIGLAAGRTVVKAPRLDTQPNLPIKNSGVAFRERWEDLLQAA